MNWFDYTKGRRKGLTRSLDTSGGHVYMLLTAIGSGLIVAGVWAGPNPITIISGLAIGGWGVGMLATTYRNVIRDSFLRLAVPCLQLATFIGLPIVYFRWAARPDWISAGYLLLTVMLLWWALYKVDSVNNVNGFGTALCGNYHHPQRGLIQTKWFIVFFVPILPIRTYEGIESISDIVTPWQHSSRLRMRPWTAGRFYWPQLIPCLIVWPLALSLPWW